MHGRVQWSSVPFSSDSTSSGSGVSNFQSHESSFSPSSSPRVLNGVNVSSVNNRLCGQKNSVVSSPSTSGRSLVDTGGIGLERSGYFESNRNSGFSEPLGKFNSGSFGLSFELGDGSSVSVLFISSTLLVSSLVGVVSLNSESVVSYVLQRSGHESSLTSGVRGVFSSSSTVYQFLFRKVNLLSGLVGDNSFKCSNGGESPT